MAKFNEIFPAGRLSIEDLYQGYEAEIVSLGAIADSKYRDQCFASIARYAEYLSYINNDEYQKNIRKIFKQNPVIYFGHAPEKFVAATLTAHIAICCELLKDITVPLKFINNNDIPAVLEIFKNHYGDLEGNNNTRNNLEFKLHSIDAFRSFQILKSLGLITAEPGKFKQLSLGAGSAKKDLRSIHLVPDLTPGHGESFLFDIKETHAKDIVIIDGDPSRAEEYKKLCEDSSYPIYTINNDAIEALDKLTENLAEKSMQKRNLVVGLRIDHQMIPDVPLFFDKLANCIDDTADFVITIGSGFSIEEFTGRTNVVKGLFDYLQEVGLEPVLIKLHGEGNLEEQWNSPSFGLKSITSFQILYCKLKLKKLKSKNKYRCMP